MGLSRKDQGRVGHFNFLLMILFALFLNGCASLPPGANFPKHASSALAHPEATRLGSQFIQ